MEPVAVVGMSVLLPGAPDLDTYWRNLVGAVDCITPVPPSYGLTAEVFPAGRGGFLGDLATVDAAALGVMPAALPHTEPDQLIALHVATAAIADSAGLGDPGRVGVILGRGGYFTAGMTRMDLRTRTVHQVAHVLADLGVDDDTRRRVREAFLARLAPPSRGSEIGLVPNLTASRIANRLGLGGPAYTVDAACASSLVAIDHAVGELTRGRCDAVLVGGVHHAHEPGLWTVFEQLGAVSGSGAIRPFDRSADGLLIGEGTGVVVLKRLDDARRAGDRIYAVVRGTGVASDGGGASLMHPGTGGQVGALRQAWTAAGLDPTAPDSIGLLEAHGTGTPAGDTAELATLREVFGDRGSAVLGSVKSMIGHTMPAAGIAGFIKAALAVHHGVLLPTLHCDDPHPDLKATRFRPIDSAREWPDGERRAAVNAFGFGGINAHVVLEAGKRERAKVREPIRVVRLAAPTVADLADRLEDRRSSDGPCRIAIVGPTERTLATARRVLAAGKPWRGRQDIWFSPRPLLHDDGKVAFLYPGLEADFDPRVTDVAEHLGRPVADLGTDGLFRHGAAVLWVGRLLDAALRAHGVRPDVLAGHSIGEWNATAIAAGYTEAEIEPVLAAFADAAREVPDVVFGVLGESAGSAERRLSKYTVTLSHDNSPHQSVICGPAVEVERVLAAARAEGVPGQVLPFRSGFHTPRLLPFLEKFEAAAAGLERRPWREPVWSTTTAAPYPDDPAGIRTLHTRHLVEPVRFRPLVERLYDSGVRAFVQVGSGQLASLVHDVLRGRDHLAVAANSPRQTGLGQLTRALAALWVEGAAVGDDLLGPVAPRTERVRLALGSPLVSVAGVVAPVPAVPQAGGRAAHAHAGVAAMVAEAEDAALAVLTAVRARSHRSPRKQAREMSLRTMPYLRDHMFFQLPPQWPDPYDGFPVVPATDLVRQMAGFACDGAPGRVAVAVREARFERWLAVEPPVEVEFEGTHVSAASVAVVARGYARATVDLADRYTSTPAPWPSVEGRHPLLTARQMYGKRWMFHGPGYQGITRIDSIGPGHVTGELTVPDAPGGLLDAAGQLVGYWVLEQCAEDNRTFPVRIAALRFHSAEPAPGERVACHVRIASVTATTIVAALQLVRADGTVWAEADGWQLRRFAYGEEVRSVDRGAGTELLARRHADGWFWVGEAWPDLASRELMARTYLTRDEFADYEAQPPQGRRQWLLGRIALKDAVRAFVRPRGDFFAVELTTGSSEDGTPWVDGRFGRELPPLAVSVAQCGEVGVALVAPAGAAAVGIAIVEYDPDGLNNSDNPSHAINAIDAIRGNDAGHADDAAHGNDANDATHTSHVNDANDADDGNDADDADHAEVAGLADRPVVAALGAVARALRVRSEDLEVTAARGAELLVGDVAVRVSELSYNGRRYVVARTLSASER